MAVSTNLAPGTSLNSPWKTCPGYTLFCPLGGKEVFLIDMNGQVAHTWTVPSRPASYGRLLPNGHLLYAAATGKSPLATVEGCGGSLVELDWHGKLLWEYNDEFMHHSFARLADGKTLILRWVPVPEAIAKNVRGGNPSSTRNETLWGDAIAEIMPSGKTVWEWKAHEHLDFEKDVICPLDPRDEWTHANYISPSANGDILISLSRINTIAIVRRETGEVAWRWGAPHELAHQHCSEFLANGNVLVFDNGLHPPGFDFGYSRVMEVDPRSSRVEWVYQTSSFSLFYSPITGGCQRLSNGNTLICEGINGRLFEVTPQHEVVWEYTSPYFGDVPGVGRSNAIFTAFRYPDDYDGLGKLDEE